MNNFQNLNENEKDLIKDLITKMASYPNYKSPKIRYNMRGYDFGEIRPMPHRFFFFQKRGNNIIFFAYALKKVNSFNDEFYKKLNKEKMKYEKEFEKYIR